MKGRETILLVDWVINTGQGILEFVRRIVAYNRKIRIVIVAGVVQAGATREMSDLVRALCLPDAVNLVALRLSENKFTGTGVTDTGNRLFNTTHLA